MNEKLLDFGLFGADLWSKNWSSLAAGVKGEAMAVVHGSFDRRWWVELRKIVSVDGVF